MNSLPLDPQNTRRDFLKKLSAASIAAMMAREPRLLAADGVKHPKPTADACILLWMGGGMAAPETFDPKRYEAYEVGKPIEKVLST
ncbi:MAG: twin-arginine translocation signal domain-containing protein, partial [Chthoniobacteraceae bacterium]